MDIGAIFLILAVVILAGLFLSRPFTDHLPNRAPAPNLPGANEYERSSLMAEYERQLNALQEMDFDHRMGKIPDEDYPQQRQALLAGAAELLRRLDASAPPASSASQVGDGSRDAEERIAEALIARPPAPAASDDLEALIAARRRARQEKASGFCPACGKPVQESDRFCPKCGARL